MRSKGTSPSSKLLDPAHAHNLQRWATWIFITVYHCHEVVRPRTILVSCLIYNNLYRCRGQDNYVHDLNQTPRGRWLRTLWTDEI